ncbi:MAG: 3'-5' exonuclease [bacterium]
MKNAMERILARPLAEVTFAFLDVETTGLSPLKGGRVCEVAVSRRCGDADLGHFHTLIHPGCGIPEEVIKIHGITDTMVAKSPRFEAVAPRLLGILDGAALVCHNAGFDVGFMEHEFSMAGLKFPRMPVLDTLKIARRHARFSRNTLGNIAAELGIDCGGWHRALSDVKITEQIFLHFLGKFAVSGAKTLKDIMAECRGK